MTAHDHVLSAKPPGGILHDRKRLGENLLELGRQLGVIRDGGELGLPIGRLLTQVVVRKLLQAGFELIDLLNNRPELFQLAVVLSTKNLLNKSKHIKRRRRYGMGG